MNHFSICTPCVSLSFRSLESFLCFVGGGDVWAGTESFVCHQSLLFIEYIIYIYAFSSAPVVVVVTFNGVLFCFVSGH